MSLFPKTKTTFSVALLAAVLLAGPSQAADDKVIVLRGATVHPVSGPAIPNGSVVVRGSQIEAVGANLEVPAGAEVIDLAGKHLYPGFVHAGTQLGLTEIESVRGTLDKADVGNFNPHHRAEIAFNADSLLLPTTLAGGVVAAHVMMEGDLFVGTSAVMRLEGWNHEDMTLASPIGQHLRFPALPPAGEGEKAEEAKKKRDEALKAVNEALEDARAYQKAKAAGSRGLDVNPKLEALLPLLEGKQKLFVHADVKAQIEGALDWAKEQGFTQLVLVAGADVQLLTERLVQEKIPVILNGTLELPARKADPYDAAFTAPAKLKEAGIPFCIASKGEVMTNRNLAFHAGMAAAFGLDKETALRSITLSPAEILGVAAQLGSLEAGKEASFFVSSGDPLEITTAIERVWVAGQEVDLEDDHQRRLWRKYEARPKPAKVAR